MNYEVAVHRLRKGFAWMEEVDYSRTRLGASVTVHTHITRHLPRLPDQNWPFIPENPIDVDTNTAGRRVAVLRLAGIPILVNSGYTTWAHLNGMRLFSTSPFWEELTAFRNVKNNNKLRVELSGLLNECMPYKSEWEYSPISASLSWGRSESLNFPLIEVLSDKNINFKVIEKDTYLPEAVSPNYQAYPGTITINGLPLLELIPFDDQLTALSDYMLRCRFIDPISFFWSEIFPAMKTCDLLLGTLDHRPCPWGPPSKWNPK